MLNFNKLKSENDDKNYELKTEINYQNNSKDMRCIMRTAY